MANVPASNIMDTNEFEVHGHLHLEPNRAPGDSREQVASSSPTDAEKYMNKKESQLEATFQSSMCREFRIADRYSEVGVLLVKWIDELDNIGVKEEVTELKDLFHNEYNFKTTLLELDIASRPQAQLNAAIAKLVLDHEGSSRNNLLIVYYSGHAEGVAGEHELKIIGVGPNSPPFPADGIIHDASAVWTRAELDLQDAQADVLMILDCCFAGNIITKGVDRNTRCFEVMTAVGRSDMARAGEDSYSKHLINVLRNEVRNPSPLPMTTHDLNEAITRSSQHFGSGLFNRHGQRTGRHISLAPLASSKDQRPSIDRSNGKAATLDLKMLFNTDSILTESDAKLLAQKLSQAAKDADEDGRMGICSLDWVGYRPSFTAISLKAYRMNKLKKQYAAAWRSIVKAKAMKRKADERLGEEEDRSKRLKRDGDDLPTPAPSALDNTPSPRR